MLFRKIKKEVVEVDTTKKVLEQAIDAVVSIDSQNKITFFNKAAERLWGYSKDEVIGKNVKMLVPMEIQGEHDDYINKNRRTNINKIVGTSRDIEVHTKAGNVIWGNLSLSKVEIDGEQTYTAFVKNISAEKEAKETTKQVLEQAIDAVVSIDENNLVTFFNKAAENLWGYRREEVLGKNVKMLVPYEIQGRHDDLIDTNRRTGNDRIVGTSRDLELYRKDGKKIWVNLSLSKIKIGDNIKYTAFLKNINEEKERQETIKQTLEQAIDAVVSIDEKNNVYFFNRAAEKLWGYDRNEVIGKNVKMLVPPEMQANHDSFIDANRKTGQDKIVGTSRELPVYRKDGSVIWGQLSLSKIELENRTLYTAFLKNVDAEVKQREKFKLLSLVADETNNSVIITDANGYIEYINPGFTKLTEYTFEDAYGKKPGSFLQGPMTDQDTVNRIRTQIRDQRPFYEEILNYTKSGKPYWISISINPVFDEHGQVKNYISVQANITNTKQKALEYRTRIKALQSSNLVLEWDRNNNIAYVNTLFAEICETSKEQLAQKYSTELDISKILTPDEFEKVRKGEPLYSELQLNLNGKEIFIAANIQTLFDFENQIDRIVLYGSDITKRRNTVQKTNDLMSDVLQKIDKISENISKIAKQTNTLSLNAGIESARVGEAGQGFGIIAQQIRNLSAKSSEAAVNITEMVKTTQKQIKELNQLIN